jgi:iron complex outermembrane receptor protein
MADGLSNNNRRRRTLLRTGRMTAAVWSGTLLATSPAHAALQADVQTVATDGAAMPPQVATSPAVRSADTPAQALASPSALTAPDPQTLAADAGPTNTVATASDIVVTAQRRSERLQDVPISITAIPPAQIKDLNLNNLVLLSQVTPGLDLGSGLNYANAYIRGVGSSQIQAGLENAVATYIDGGYVARSFGGVYDVIDTQSVQVLKGPQGSLWGRNATGGAILVTTADPGRTFAATVDGQVGSLEHARLDGVVNVPLNDAIAIRVAGRYRTDGDYIRGLADGAEYGRRRNWTLRGKIGYDPGTDFRAVLQVQVDRSRASPDQNAQFLPSAACAFCGTSRFSYPLPDPYTTAINSFEGAGIRNKSEFYGLRMEYSPGAVDLVSNTTYRHMDGRSFGDYDLTETGTFNLGQNSGAKTFTQSLIATTSLGDRLQLSGGVDYFWDRSFFNLYIFTQNVLPTGAPDISNTVTTNSISGFAEGTYELFDGFKLTAGGRYTYDHRRFTGQKTSFNSFTPRLVAAYDLGTVNLYASYNKGFKAGGFSIPAAPNAADAVDPEKIDGFEVGAKFVSPDRSFRANIAGFWYDYKNLQVVVTDQSNPNALAGLRNAASARGKGIDVDFDYRPIPDVQLFGGVEYLHSFFRSYPGAQVSVVQFDPQGRPTGSAVSFVDLSGTRLPHAAKWTGNVGATLRSDLGANWKGMITGLLNFTSSYSFFPSVPSRIKTDVQPAYALVKLSARVMPHDDRFYVGAYVENLTDKVYYDYRYFTAPFGALQNVARPRTYGVDVGVRF